MSLTPEQFNKIAMKEELNEVKEDVKEIKGDIKKILTAVDAIAKNNNNVDQELTANKAAHERIQTDVNEVREYVKMDIKNPVVNDGEEN